MDSETMRKIRLDAARNRHVLVALSGGADSVALLLLLHRNRAKYAMRISAAHFHHGIRGDAADGDAAYCRELCADLKIELIEARADIPRIARNQKKGLETVAREERYRFLRNAKQQCGADLIALAHHLDDQAETVLMHLLRGCGPSGITGMAFIEGDLYRPLLEIPKRSLIQFLEEARISWREDASNGIADTPRNALRLNVLPEIEKSYPAAASAIARYARLARCEDDYIARKADQMLSARLQHGPYGRRLMLDGNEEEALLRRCIRSIAGNELPAEKVEAVFDLSRKERGKLDISGSLRAEKTPTALYFLPKETNDPPAVPLKIPGETLLPGICRIHAEVGNFPMEPDNPNVEIFDAQALDGAVLRLRRNGDKIHPLGAPGEKLLSDYLTDRKMDRPLRDVLPLIAVGSQIIWVCGVGMHHSARIQNVTLRTVRLKINFITDEKVEVQL